MKLKITLSFIQSILTAIMAFCKDNGLFPSVAIAQAILESASGTSVLSKRSNNLFGIKASLKYAGQKVAMQTSEYINKKLVKSTASFRKYNSYLESIEDRTRLLIESPRYKKAGVFNSVNARQQADALQMAGFATDPEYANKLMEIIRVYDLEQYDTHII